ncbi:MAG: hypothetical protein ACFFCW_01945 [Candidatus Hodarchaeota archaeon]
MAEYGKIYRKLWRSRKFKELAVVPGAQLLYIYILSCPHGNSIGYFNIDKLYIQADFSWNKDEFERAFSEIILKKFVFYDEKTCILLINNWFEYNPIFSPKQLQKAFAELSEIPRNPLDKLFLKSTRFLSKKYRDTFRKEIRKGNRTVSVSVSESESESESVAVSEGQHIPHIQNPEIEKIYQTLNMSDLNHLLKPDGRRWISNLIAKFGIDRVQAGFDSMLKKSAKISGRPGAWNWIENQREDKQSAKARAEREFIEGKTETII